MAQQEATLLIKIKEAGSAALDKIGLGLSNIAGIAAAAGAAIVAFASAAIASYKEEEAAINKLNQSMVNNGDYTKQASVALQGLASELQKNSAFSDDAAISALAVGKSFGVTNEKAKEFLNTAANLAAATGTDLVSAAETLGRSFSGTVPRALAMTIPALKDLTEEQLKSGAAIDLVAQKYDGYASAQVAGLGAMDQLKNTLGDFMDNVGKGLAPMVSYMARSLNDLAQGFLTNVDVAGAMSKAMDLLVILFISGKQVAETFALVVGTGVYTALESVAQALQGNFKESVETVGVGMDAIKGVIQQKQEEADAELAAYQALKDAQTLAQQEKEQQMVAQSEANKTLIKRQEQDKQMAEQKKKNEEQLKIEKDKAAAEIAIMRTKADLMGFYAGAISNIAGKESKIAFLAMKAAGVAQAIVSAHVAAGQALAVIPPPGNLAFAKMTLGLGYANAAAIAATGIQGLAEGGIVKARTGGMPAIIGEGGRDEAVIPLEDGAPAMKGLGSTVIIQAGAFVGDASSAREFAKMVDKELFKLRQDNASVSFEGIA